SGIANSFSFALVGAGHLCGLSVGVAMGFGYVVAWLFATPILSALHPIAGDVAEVGKQVWSTQVRFIGAGAIGVAALYALGQLLAPVLSGIRDALAASRQRALGQELPLQERDIPIGVVGLVTVALLVPIAIVLAVFLSGSPVASVTVPLVIGGAIYILVA